MECLFTLKVSSHTRPHLSLILNKPPQAQVGSVSDGIRCPLRLTSIRIDIAESVFQLALCVVVKSVLRLASFLRGFSSRLFSALLRGFSSRLCCMVAETTRYCVVSSVLLLKLGRSRIVNPRSVMNCHSLSAPKAFVKMSTVVVTFLRHNEKITSTE